MDIKTANRLFAALSQETRLTAFRLLVKAGQGGLPAGEISNALDVPHNSLSFHLSHLVNAGIVTSRRDGRSIIYTANFAEMTALIRFLAEDCCSHDIATIAHDSGCAVITLPDC